MVCVVDMGLGVYLVRDFEWLWVCCSVGMTGWYICGCECGWMVHTCVWSGCDIGLFYGTMCVL